MRVASTAASLTTHVIVVLAAVWSSAVRRDRPDQIIVEPPLIFPQPADPSESDGFPLPVIGGDVVVPPIDVATFDGFDAEMLRITLDARPGPRPGPLFAGGGLGEGSTWDPSLVDELPMMLTGPVPAYPDLLRQAGLQGRVVLEAVIDTLGHVEPGSVVVVESAHPGFVAPAQQSLLKALFRPARVRGMAVRVRVRVPIEFVLRGGGVMGR